MATLFVVLVTFGLFWGGVEGTYIERRVVYEPIKCEDDPQTCPKWNYCHPNGYCQPCGGCPDYSGRSQTLCTIHPTLCIPDPGQYRYLRSCPSIDVADTGSNGDNCSGTCSPLKIIVTTESPLGTICKLRCKPANAAVAVRNQRVQCIWDSNLSKAIWNDTIMSGFGLDVVMPTSPSTASSYHHNMTSASSNLLPSSPLPPHTDYYVILAIVIGVGVFIVLAVAITITLLVVKRPWGSKTICQIIQSRLDQVYNPDNLENTDTGRAPPSAPVQSEAAAAVKCDDEQLVAPTVRCQPGENIAPSDDDDDDVDVGQSDSSHSLLSHTDNNSCFVVAVAALRQPCQNSAPSSRSTSSEDLSVNEASSGCYSTKNSKPSFPLPLTTNCTVLSDPAAAYRYGYETTPEQR